MSRRKPNTPKTVHYDIDMTQVMLDRIFVAAENEGVTMQTFIEQALREAVKESEKSTPHRNRDPAEYPHECHCGERFKLPMHLANHQRAAHPDPFVEPSQLEQEITVQVESTKGTNIGQPSMRSEILVASDQFKLGVDPKYIEMPPEEDDDDGDPEITDLTGSSNDFSADVPDFG